MGRPRKYEAVGQRAEASGHQMPNAKILTRRASEAEQPPSQRDEGLDETLAFRNTKKADLTWLVCARVVVATTATPTAAADVVILVAAAWLTVAWLPTSLAMAGQAFQACSARECFQRSNINWLLRTKL